MANRRGSLHQSLDNDRSQEGSMAIEAEIEAAVVAMRAISVRGAKVHEEVLRAYAQAAVEAAEQARRDDFQRRARLNNKPSSAGEPELTGNELLIAGVRPADLNGP
jgi:hypothetical protein